MKLVGIFIAASLGLGKPCAALAIEPQAQDAAREDGKFGTCLGDGALFCLFGMWPRPIKPQKARAPSPTATEAALENLLRSMNGSYSGSAQDNQETMDISRLSVNSWAISLEFESGAFQGVARSILTIKGGRLFVGMNRDGSDGTEASILELSADALAYRYDPRPDVPQAPVFMERLELGTDSIRHEATVTDKNGKRLQSKEFFLRRIK